ncbi:MAG TPA: FG-GAP-like repeat-containing protein [Candidatus Eisenbacteria bacterium]|nr:FG-GAP-like repeat-containing protein [Candidatus Eisenbacteria bacterium]
MSAISRTTPNRRQLMGFARRHGGCLLLALGLILPPPASSTASWDPLFRGAQAFDVGTWPPTSNYRHSSPSQLVAGDLNADGRPDIVVVNRDVIGTGGRTMSVLLHSQDPSARSAFLPKATYPTLVEPMHVELADMNLDGHLDAVVRSVLDSVCVMLGTGTGTFGEPVHRAALGTHAEYSAPRAMVLADVNQDGLPDVLTAGTSTGGFPIPRISVLLGAGGGSLAPPTLFDANSDGQGYSLAVQDFTGDGIADVVVGVSGGATLLQGSGTGMFGYVQHVLSVVDHLITTTVTDLNGDSAPDLVFSGFSMVYTLVNTGGGTFSAGSYAAPNASAEFVELGDVNLDGSLDLVTSGFGRPISVRLGNGNGTFTSAMVHASPHSWSGDFRLVDVNMNGRLDLVVSSPGSSTARPHMVSLLLDDGSIGFQSVVASTPFLSGVRHPAVADFDQNGKLDVAVSSSNLIEIGLGNGNGTFVGMVGGPASMPGTIVAGDWNRDGKDDIAFQYGAAIVGWTGTGTGGFSGMLAFSIQGHTLHHRSVADMNRDGLQDLVVVNPAHEVRVFTQNLDGTFTANAPGDFNSTFRSLVLGDWNRDGFTDVIVAEGVTGLPSTAAVTFYPGFGNGMLGVGRVVSRTVLYADLCAGDFNRDGKLDLAMLETLAGQSGLRGIDVALGNGSGGFLMAPSVPTLEQNGNRIESWDVNLDGVPDLVSSAMADRGTDPLALDQRTSSIEVHLGNGTGQFGPPLAYSLEVTDAATDRIGAPLFAVGDVNRDDSPDVLFPGYVPGEFRSLLATPPDFGNALSPRVDYAMTAGASRVAMGDLNRDGILDVVTSSTSNPVSVRLGTQQGALGTATSVAQSLNARHLELADVNRDGKLDLLLTRAGLGFPDLMACMLGNGDGTFGPRLDHAIEGITEFALGDMNRDGKLDIVAAKSDPAFSVLRTLFGNGDGTFTLQAQQAPVPTTQIYDVEIGDVGHDGILDAVVAGGGVYLLRGSITGLFSAGFTVDLGNTTYRTVCLADFDRDGYVDLAAANQALQVAVAWGSGVQPFSTALFSNTPANAWDLQAGPAERDGRQFLYVTMANSKVAVLQPSVNPGVFGTAGSYDTGPGPEALALGDLNRDGLLDVITANSGSGDVSVFSPPGTLVTGVTTTPAPVLHARLDQNAPNPFNPETTIRFAVPEPGQVQLSIYDIHGRLVSKLVDGPLPAGEHAIRWDGRSATGESAASGVYYYRLRTARENESRKMVLVK